MTEYEQVQRALPPGSVLLVFSDGLNEAPNDEGQEYDEARLLDFALRNRDSSVQALGPALFEEIDRWLAGQERR